MMAMLLKILVMLKYIIFELKDWKFYVHFKNGWLVIKNGDVLKNEKNGFFCKLWNRPIFGSLGEISQTKNRG